MKHILAQALAVAHNPGSSSADLMNVVGDLIVFGALDTADQTLASLRQRGETSLTIAKLELLLKWLRTLRPQFEEAFLLGAMETARDPDATNEQLLKAAENLVVWGAIEEADAALGRLKAAGALKGKAMRIAAASHQLRRSGILRELASLTAQSSLNKPYEVLVREKPGAARLIIVFTGVAHRFWISLNALHHYLRRTDAHVVYLSDHSTRMYLNGIESVGPGYETMLSMLRKQIGDLRPQHVHVLATSAGGYVGLRAAIDLQAESFAGMSIRTSMIETEALPMSPFERRALEDCRYPEMIGDLRSHLEDAPFPKRVQLWCGDRSLIDLAHAEHLGDIARVEVRRLADYKPHDTISGLIARGQFEDFLAEFIGVRPAGAP